MPVYTGKKGTINLIEEEKNGGQTVRKRDITLI